MEGPANICRKPYDIPSIRWYFRMIQDDLEHSWPYDTKNPLLTNFLGLTFNTPIVLLSGCVGFGHDYPRIAGFSHHDVGGVCLKGTTLNPRLGNKPHRVWETPMGMLNAIGLQNPGAPIVINEILPTLNFKETRWIANVSGASVDEYAKVCELFDQSLIDAIEVNISCPNVREGGAIFGNSPDMSARVVEACRKATSKPLIAKLSPNQTNIAENARRCVAAGADGLAVINTISGMAIDVETRKPILGHGQGGLSGPAIKPIALLKVRQVYEAVREYKVPIIGQGGIMGWSDAVEFFLAGASAVGVGTALFREPLVCKKITQGLVRYLSRHNFAHVSELIGAMDE